MEFPMPTAMKDAWSSLEGASYYKRFIHKFSDIAEPTVNEFDKKREHGQ